MGISKVEINNADGTKNVLVDLTGDTVTENDLPEGITAHGADGELVTGILKDSGNISDYPYTISNVPKHTGPTVKYLDSFTNSIKQTLPKRIQLQSYFSNLVAKNGRCIMDTSKDNKISLASEATNFGDATAEDVVSGKTFTSVAGLKVNGTHVCKSPDLQSKNVTPSEESQTVTPDTGYDGLSQVSIGAISSTYVGSGVAKKSDQTYTPTTSDQIIAKDQYLSGDQTIKGAANLTASNIKKDVHIFGIIGTYEASGGSGSSDDNCEAYHITDKSTALNFKRTDGDIKVWGYGFKSSGMYQKTVYAFCGDGYYTGTSYGTPKKTSVTWSFNTDGTLSGLPSGLTALDVLVTKGI